MPVVRARQTCCEAGVYEHGKGGEGESGLRHTDDHAKTVEQRHGTTYSVVARQARLQPDVPAAVHNVVVGQRHGLRQAGAAGRELHVDHVVRRDFWVRGPGGRGLRLQKGLVVLMSQ